MRVHPETGEIDTFVFSLFPTTPGKRATILELVAAYEDEEDNSISKRRADSWLFS